MNYKKISKEIAAYLFSYGHGDEKALRLVHELPDGSRGGGYIETAVAAIIEKKLSDASVKNKRRKAKP